MSVKLYAVRAVGPGHRPRKSLASSAVLPSLRLIRSTSEG
jgi:hypothetical protein